MNNDWIMILLLLIIINNFNYKENEKLKKEILNEEDINV